MASWLMRMVSSSRKSSRRRRAIWSGLQAVGPPPVLPTPVSAALPRHDGPVHRCPVRGDDETGEPVLHVTPQRLVDRQLGRLGTAGGAVGVPLRGRGPVLQTATARGGVAAQLTRDRGRRTPQPASDLPYALALCATQRDLLAFSEHQIPLRWRLR